MTALALAPSPRANDQATRLRALVNAGVPAARPAGPRAAPQPAPARGHARIIAIGSGKGGVGKTSLAVNLSIALAGLGCRTTLLDADLGTANADVICGLMPGVRLEHVIRPGSEARSLRDIAVDAPGGFRLVPGSAGIARMADLPAPEREHLVGAISDLERGADVVVIDTGAGVGPVVLDFLRAADLALVIATPEPTAIADAYALIKCLCSATLEARLRSANRPAREATVALVVNQAADEHEARAVHARIAAVSARFLGLALPLAGCIAQDLRVATAVRSRKPLLLGCPRSPAARNIRGLASVIAQQMALGKDPRTDHSRRGRLSGLFARLRVC